MRAGSHDVYHFRRDTLLLGGGLVVLSPVLFVLAVAMVLGPGSPAVIAVLVLLQVALGAFSAALGAGMAVSRVSLHDGGVRVRNPFRTYELAWADVSHFEVGLHQGFGRPAAGAILHLRNGRTIEPRALRRSGMVWNLTRHRDEVARVVAALNERLAERAGRCAPE